MIRCTDLNSFRTCSQADKVRSFFRLLRCDRGSNAIVIPTSVTFINLNFHFCQRFSNFQMAKPQAKNLKFEFSSDSYSIYIKHHNFYSHNRNWDFLCFQPTLTVHCRKIFIHPKLSYTGCIIQYCVGCFNLGRIVSMNFQPVLGYLSLYRDYPQCNDVQF